MNGTETGSATLAELCDLISEQVHPADVPEALYVGLEHVTPGRLRRSGGGIAADVQSHKYAFRRNDILYGKLRPYLDKAILADTDGVCTTELLVLRAKPGVDPRFLACLVHDPDFVEHALTGVTGAHHPRTSWAHIAQFECPRFSYEEQQAIAALLWRIQDLLKVCEDTLEVAQDLKRAAMRELFTRGLRGEPQKETEIGPVPESWRVVELGSLCLPTDQVDLISEGDRVIHYIDVSSVSRESLRVETTTEYLLKDAPGRARKRVRSGDVIFATIRPTLLRAARIDEALDNQVCSTAFCVLRTADPEQLGKYVFYAVQRPEFLELLTRIETGASYPAVTDRQVKAQPIPLPPPDEQREIVAILEAIDRKIALHRDKRRVLEDLFKALLHKLMTGEIRVSDLDLSTLEHADESTSSAAEEAV